jgi:hypothetical protein
VDSLIGCHLKCEHCRTLAQRKGGAHERDETQPCAVAASTGPSPADARKRRCARELRRFSDAHRTAAELKPPQPNQISKLPRSARPIDNVLKTRRTETPLAPPPETLPGTEPSRAPMILLKAHHLR